MKNKDGILTVIYKGVNELIPYVNNPRNNEAAVDKVASSIQEFGFKVPIIVDSQNVIIAGHTRFKASKKLGLKEVPCIVSDDLTEAQIKAFRIADNKVSELATWDEELLSLELEQLVEMGYDLELTGVEMDELDELLDDEDEQEEDKYTSKMDVPQYEITGECPRLDELVDCEKTDELIKAIQNSNVSEQEKAFLLKAATRHEVFDYAKIAEYYAHADHEMQALMEDSALVIIDYADAIRNGYSNLYLDISEMCEEDSHEG
mgnify:CR=1 FL=1